MHTLLCAIGVSSTPHHINLHSFKRRERFPNIQASSVCCEDSYGTDTPYESYLEGSCIKSLKSVLAVSVIGLPFLFIV